MNKRKNIFKISLSLATFGYLVSTAFGGQLLVDAISMVESSGGKNVYNPNENAHGPLQIRQLALTDVNQRYNLNLKLKDVYCIEISTFVFWAYTDMYATKKRLGREPTKEDRARIWNGGPNGFRQSSTLGYWKKVQNYLKQND
jgi:hypothetical protein